MICMLTLPDQSHIASYIATYKASRVWGHAPWRMLKIDALDYILGHFQSNADKVDKLYTNSYIHALILT